MLCPRCGEEEFETNFGALSRWDNKTIICPTCGREEALLQYYLQETARSTTDKTDKADMREMLRSIVDPNEGVVLWAKK